MEFKNENNKKYLIIALAVIAVVSLLVALNTDLAISLNKGSIEYLDKKKTDVESLALMAFGTSLLLNALPGDMGTSIANQLAGTSKYLLIILSGVFLEKYILSITTFALIGIAIPVACIFFIIYLIKNSYKFKVYAKKTLIMFFAFFLVIPTSVQISKLFESTFESTYQEIETINK